jgi:hypothetical protein
MKNVFLCAAFLAGSVFAFANDAKSTEKVDALKNEASIQEDDLGTYSDCTKYEAGMVRAGSGGQPMSVATLMYDMGFWHGACEAAGGCPCTVLDPVELDPR